MVANPNPNPIGGQNGNVDGDGERDGDRVEQVVQPRPQNPANIAQGQDHVNQVVDQRGMAVQQRFLDFLQNFRDEEDEDSNTQSQTQGPQEEYVYQLDTMRNDDRNTILVNYKHVLIYDQSLAEAIKLEYYRFLPFVEKAVQTFVRIHHPDYSENERGVKDFHVSLFGLPEVAKLRTLVTDKIGQLISFTGLWCLVLDHSYQVLRRLLQLVMVCRFVAVLRSRYRDEDVRSAAGTDVWSFHMQ